MKQLLNRLTHHEILSKAEAKQALINISEGKANHSQIASFLTVYMMRSITIEELAGFRDALLELAVPINLSGYNPIDLCGTGGDGKNTFNISTLASFITAGAGVNVTKHGNYSVSSVSGSSNVLENLGVKFSNDQAFLETCLEKAGICVLHAPLFHPAMKFVAPVRKDLAVKTFFNMLGPIVNPVKPSNQVVGVFSLELARIYSYLYQHTDTNFRIVHALDGYDEVSLTGDTKIVGNQINTVLTPEDFNAEKIKAEEIYGGETIPEAVKLFQKILNNEGSKAQNQVVCANAALAISTAKKISIAEALSQAEESLKSGKALEKLKILQKLSA
ncbi:anthranilate phosphoribosyltransferase [Mesonia mobilis]|uniref:Anthranilate phosphoribosyltransferase n=1 Tax=Mesonia mobilis TaxID=369791 RepID=A0ABQ3BNJ9_9FLAO|nr:anthranilate phosphoribosyltransferase [Mesonia mobilis]MBQ0738458.1 anthranilate phosphoribosyltransferase [Aquimarina celericrescens]GGZ47352.1 anthranilate phosphoribosyltransferase [Mesonia mobilis]